MKKLLLFLLPVLVIVALFVYAQLRSKDELVQNPSPKVQKEELKVSPKQLQGEIKGLFVTYWTIDAEISDLDYDEVIYFGITADKNGLNRKDQGFKKLEEFVQLNKIKRSVLTLRMTNSEINSFILRNKNIQKQIIKETVELAEQKGFYGVLFDFEINAVPFDSLINEINVFSKDFYIKSKEENLVFYIALYGDTFYRARPYDVKYLSENSDKILIMAYDFHKARGNPGPNFPLSGKEKYGYDLKKMVDDFVKVVSKDKIIIVFGMYGYDWVVDENKKVKEEGTPLSLNEINKLLGKCQASCKTVVDNEATETELTYQDSELNTHEVWYETMESVKKKKTFLKEKGIVQTVFWAYSYF